MWSFLFISNHLQASGWELASIRDQFPRLMEAAPDPLLSCLEHLLEAAPGDVDRLFVEGSGALGGGGLHTGLLWGLETLAWIPEYLQRVTLLLAKLAGLDPGGKLSNRPINSLAEIFLWWHPGTQASSAERLEAIRSILRSEPEVGWDLLAMLLPGIAPSFSNPTAKPRWKVISTARPGRRDIVEYASAIVDLALEDVGTRPERWKSILKSLRHIRISQCERALELLENVTKQDLPSDDRIELWRILRDFCTEHRRFPDADWTLPEEVLGRLGTLMDNVTPDDPVERHRWLFNQWLPKSAKSHSRGDEDYEKELKEKRQNAVREILSVQGPGGLVRLSTSCEFPGFVAEALVADLKNSTDALKLIGQVVAIGDEGLVLETQISRCAYEAFGKEWQQLVLKGALENKWSPVAVASLMLWWPDGTDTWKTVRELGEKVESEYWHRKNIGTMDSTLGDPAYEIDCLLASKRAPEVFRRLAMQSQGVASPQMLQVFDATLDALQDTENREEVRGVGLHADHFREFLDELRGREEIPRDELARREYVVLPLLEGLTEKGLTLHEFIAGDPNFFVEVICDVYPPDASEGGEIEPDRKKRAVARTSYALLNSLHRLPGRGGGGDIDEAFLSGWVESARDKARELDRSVVVDEKIGELLAHAPEDTNDGAWPHQAVRNIIETLASEDIEQGISIGRFNMRGVVVKDPLGGGDAERTLAAQYRSWESVIHSAWPRTAQLLSRMAHEWELVAGEEDVRSDQLKHTMN